VYQEFNRLKQGAFVSLDHFVSVFSVVIAFLGLLLVAIQMRNATRQREAESLVKLTDINRELLSLGFSHQQLFPILEDADDADPVWERRYLQLWLNQLSLVHLYLKRSVVDNELRQSLERSLADFMTLKNMRRQWQRDRATYPDSFQRLVDGLIAKGEPPLTTARHASDAQQLAGNFLERGTRHPHKGFTTRRGQDRVLGGSRNETLHEHVAIVGEDSGGTHATIAQLGKLPVFPNNFLDSHNLIFRVIQFLKQNYANCFNPEWRGAFV
jgi:hypothetical protein